MTAVRWVWNSLALRLLQMATFAYHWGAGNHVFGLPWLAAVLTITNCIILLIEWEPGPREESRV